MANPEMRIEKLSSYMGKNLSQDEIKDLVKNYSLDKNLKRIKSGEHRTKEKKGTIAAKSIYFESNHIGPNLGASIGDRLPVKVKEYIYSNHKIVFDYFDYSPDR
jgi:hypothetical protein